MPDKFENATSFFRLGLPSTLIRMNPDKFSTEKGTFRKKSPEWKNLKTPASRFTVDGEHSENGTFRNRWRHYYLVWFLWQRCIFQFRPD